MYVDKEDIPLGFVGDDTAESWYTRIGKHEVLGLKNLGCVVSNGNVVTRITHPEINLPFFNRLLGLRDPDISILKGTSFPASLVVPSFFTKGVDIEQSALELGWLHTLSSIVLVKELDRPLGKEATSYKPVFIDAGNPSKVEDGFSLFSSFFLKPGEDVQGGFSRFKLTLPGNPHLVAYSGKVPVGLVGSVVYGDTVSLYTGIIDEAHRGGPLLDSMMLALSTRLVDIGVRYVYMKTRNRVVSLYSQRVYGVKHLYNERVYEKQT